MKNTSLYAAALLISTALAVATPALAEDTHGAPGMQPPGAPIMMQGEHDGMSSDANVMASTSVSIHHGPMRPAGDMGTSTDGRPPMMNGDHEFHGGMIGSTTGARPSMHGDDHPGMGSSTDMDHGTSTPPRPGVRAFISSIFNFFAGHHDGASSTPSHMDGDAGMMASTSMDASTTSPAPHGVMGFFQHLFSFFH